MQINENQQTCSARDNSVVCRCIVIKIEHTLVDQVIHILLKFHVSILKDGVVRDVGSCRDLCAMTVVSAVRLHLEQLANANYRPLWGRGEGV